MAYRIPNWFSALPVIKRPLDRLSVTRIYERGLKSPKGAGSLLRLTKSRKSSSTSRFSYIAANASLGFRRQVSSFKIITFRKTFRPALLGTMFIPLIQRLEETINVSAGLSFLMARGDQTLNTTVSSGASSSSTTQHQLSDQWTNPSDVLSVLLIIGGDIVQKALAQATGGYFTPVCFSFGWVAYSLNALISILGDGRLLPEPDHPVKVFNLDNGYVRENKNWIIGRVLRDNIMSLNKTQPIGGNAIRIAVYDAQNDGGKVSAAGSGRIRGLGVTVMLLQLIIAVIPIALYREWGVLMVTGAGTLLALLAGALPQWRVEKCPGQRRSRKNFALTSGNGARDILIIRGNGQCIDLEELAATQMPRSSRAWESHPLLSKPIMDGGKPKKHSNGSEWREIRTYRGIPFGFWITMTVVGCQFVLWLALLIAVAGLRSHVWFLLLVGGLGMLQNIIVAASSREPEKRNLSLRPVEVILTRKVMDGLMDLEVTFKGFGEALVKEFFPGKLRKEETEWWTGNTEPYDTNRLDEISRRGRPRLYLPKYTDSFCSSQVSIEKPGLAPERLPTKVAPPRHGDRSEPQGKKGNTPAMASSKDHKGEPSGVSGRHDPSYRRSEVVTVRDDQKPSFTEADVLYKAARTDTDVSSLDQRELHKMFPTRNYPQ